MRGQTQKRSFSRYGPSQAQAVPGSSMEVCDLELIHRLMDLLLSHFDIFCLFVIIHSR